MKHTPTPIWVCDSCSYKSNQEPNLWTEKHKDRIELRLNENIVTWCNCDGKLHPYIPKSSHDVLVNALQSIVEGYDLCKKGAFVTNFNPYQIAKEALESVK